MMEWIVTSSVLILIVALLRLVLKGKISLRLQYALWALVLVRLLCPVNLISSPTSVLNVAKEAASQPEIRNVIENVQEPIRFESKGYEIDPQTGESIPVTSTYYMAPSNDMNNPYSTEDILMRLWIMGVVLTFGFMLTCNLHFRFKIRRDRIRVDSARTSLPVYVSGSLETPCMVGFFNPTIYLTPESVENETSLCHILEHELTHYHHCDYITAPLRCIALALHWYNPLVWWAAKASRLDGELACDEGTIARLGEGERTGYGKTLIQMTCNHRHLTDVMLTATTMSGSKYSIKERITRIAKKPHMAAATLAVVILTALIAVGCTFTGASGDMSKSLKAELREQGQQYLDEVHFKLYKSEETAPYVMLFLPEYMPKEGLTVELKVIRDDGSEQILYTQDTVQLGEKYIITDLRQYLDTGELNLSMHYTVDGEVVGQRYMSYFYDDMVIWVTGDDLEPTMPESVEQRMSDYAGDYFSEKLEKHNNQLFLPEDEKYNGVSYSSPKRMSTPMAEEQHLYLYRVDARYPRADGEKIEDQVYILMHWNGENWEYVTLASQDTIDSYDTQEMQDKYGGAPYDAPAMELYLVHKDRAEVLTEEELSAAVSVTMRPAANLPDEMWQLQYKIHQLVLTTMEEDYPGRSAHVYVTDTRLMELSPEDPDFQLCYLAFYPELADGGRGMNYDLYLVIREDEYGVPYFVKTYEARQYSTPEAMAGYDSVDEAAKALIWQSMLEEKKQIDTGDATLSALLSELEDPFDAMTLELNGSGAALTGRKMPSAANLAMELISESYELWDADAELTGNYVTIRVDDLSSVIVYYETGYAQLLDGDTARIFRNDGYGAARRWYDEAEYVAAISQIDPIIEDQGQTPGQAALEYCQYYENVRTQVSDGSCYGFSYVSCTVEIDEEQTEERRTTGEIDENTWCFHMKTIFVPENEAARAMSYAGNTQEYFGEDPAVPDEALQYSRVGYVTLTELGWISSLVGTGW